MKRHIALLSLALMSPPLLAQEPTPAPHEQQMPNPKTKEHDALATLVGTWRTHAKVGAMPGVPGMEDPTEWIGFENARLVCNGLWLEVTGEGKCNDKVSFGMWLLGYDPFKERYRCLFASDM